MSVCVDCHGSGLMASGAHCRCCSGLGYVSPSSARVEQNRKLTPKQFSALEREALQATISSCLRGVAESVEVHQALNAYEIAVESQQADRIVALDCEAEHERIRLAACTVAALGNTREAVATRIAQGHPMWSASYGDVCAAVDREMAYREQLADATARLQALEQERDTLTRERDDAQAIAIQHAYADATANYEQGLADGRQQTIDQVITLIEAEEGKWLAKIQIDGILSKVAALSASPVPPEKG